MSSLLQRLPRPMVCACAALRFRVLLFARWSPPATCVARAGCWAGPSSCCPRRRQGAARALLQALAQDRDAQRRAAQAYGGAADRLLDLLGRHLADEEDLVIPAMLEHGERSLA